MSSQFTLQRLKSSTAAHPLNFPLSSLTPQIGAQIAPVPQATASKAVGGLRHRNGVAGSRKQEAAAQNFFKKRVLKKIKIQKRGGSWEKFEKWVPPARSSGGRHGAGDIPPNQRAGCSKSFL
jgi:hypothetical protein